MLVVSAGQTVLVAEKQHDVHDEDSGDEFKVTHDFAPKEREILVEGGLLHFLKEHGEQTNGARPGSS